MMGCQGRIRNAAPVKMQSNHSISRMDDVNRHTRWILRKPSLARAPVEASALQLRPLLWPTAFDAGAAPSQLEIKATAFRFNQLPKI